MCATGDNFKNQCNARDWKLFNSIDSLEQERKEMLNSEKDKLQSELANLRGIFTGRRRREIETRLCEIEEELKKLS